MFNQAGEASMPKECRPDPEQMLQERRAHRDKVDGALLAFKLVHASNLYLSGGRENGDEATRLIGALTVEKWNAERRIEQLLKEIDR